MTLSQQQGNYVITFDTRQITTQQLTIFKMALLDTFAISYAGLQQSSIGINGLRY